MCKLLLMHVTYVIAVVVRYNYVVVLSKRWLGHDNKVRGVRTRTHAVRSVWSSMEFLSGDGCWSSVSAVLHIAMQGRAFMCILGAVLCISLNWILLLTSVAPCRMMGGLRKRGRSRRFALLSARRGVIHSCSGNCWCLWKHLLTGGSVAIMCTQWDYEQEREH